MFDGPIFWIHEFRSINFSFISFEIMVSKIASLGRTVKNNMDNGNITTPEQFKEDMILTFANAMKYNPPEHDVHKMAKALNELFVQKWEKEEETIKQKWRLESSGGHHTPSVPGVHASESVGMKILVLSSTPTR